MGGSRSTVHLTAVVNGQVCQGLGWGGRSKGSGDIQQCTRLFAVQMMMPFDLTCTHMII